MDAEVVLLANDATSSGTAARRSVHRTSTPFHLAYSCYVFDAAEQVLIASRGLSGRTCRGYDQRRLRAPAPRR